MTNQDKFREWYIQQVNPRTGLPYEEASVSTYIAAINRLVRLGLVRNDILEVSAEEFDRQIAALRSAELAEMEHHGNLSNGIKWWRRFLDKTREIPKVLHSSAMSSTRPCCQELGHSYGESQIPIPPIKNGFISKDFFKDIMSIPSCSGKEQMMKEYIRQFAHDREIMIEEDGKGNLYLTKGKTTNENGYYPCLVNHLDTVQDWQESFIDFNKRLNVLERLQNGHTELYTADGGIGADDKLGCAIALALLDQLPVAKAAFFVEEEIGMRGSKELDRNWFRDVGFCLSFDSPGRNRSSRSCSGRQLYTDTFFNEVLSSICARHGITNFKDEPYTDVTQIRDQTPIMCYNVGNGGYEAHRYNEYLVVEDAQAVYKFGLDLLSKVGENQYWFEG